MSTNHWIMFVMLFYLPNALIASGGGTIYLKFVSYSNPDSNLASGGSCDNFGEIECDPTFKYIKLSTNTGKVLINTDTYHFDNVKEITRENAGPLSQTWSVDVDEALPSYLVLDVHIDEKDRFSYSTALIARFKGRFEILAKGFEAVEYNDVVLSRMDVNPQNRVTLNFQIGLICRKYYYGKRCDKYCKSDGVRTLCDNAGEVICEPGWTGPACQTRDLCFRDPCPKYSTCTLEDDNRTCYCNSTTASFCINGANCKPSDFVKDNFYVCECKKNYHGKHCEVFCAASENYKCSNAGEKICEPGWIKPDCDSFDYCSNMSCPMSAKCLNDPENKGRNCICNSTECPCANQICLNGGTCVYDENGKPQCSCIDDFEPPSCQYKTGASRTDKQESHIIKMMKENFYVVVSIAAMGAIISLAVITISVFCCRYKSHNKMDDVQHSVIFVRRRDNDDVEVNHTYDVDSQNPYLSVGNLLEKPSEYELCQDPEGDYEQAGDDQQITAETQRISVIENSDPVNQAFNPDTHKPPVPARSLSTCEPQRQSPKVNLRKQMTLR